MPLPHTFRRIAWGLTLSTVVLAAVGIALNAVDAAPSPEAQPVMAALQAPPPADPPAATNGYLWMLGLQAPPGVAPTQWGQDHVQRLRTLNTLLQEVERTAPRLSDGATPVATALRPAIEVARAELARFDGVPSEAPWCRPEDAPCLPALAARRVELVTQHAQNQGLLSRIAQMHAAPVFQETYLPTTFDAPPSPGKGLNLSQQAVFLAAALRMNAGDAAGAADLLQADAAFQRRVLASASTVITKLVANQMLARNLLFAHEVLRQPGVSPGAVNRYLAVVWSPLTPAEHSLRKGLDQEAQIVLRRLMVDVVDSDVGVLKGALARYFYHPQRTINCYVDRFQPLLALDQLPARGLPQALAEQRRREGTPVTTPWYRSVVNPMGVILCDRAAPQYAAYIGRQYDLEALRRAVALSLSATGRFADTLPALSRQPALFNPYTDAPFTIDPASQTLSFQPAVPDAGWAAKMGGTLVRGR